MKLGQKLPLAFASVLLLVACAALYGIYSLKQAIAVYDIAVSRYVEDERTIADIGSEFKTQVQEWKNTLLRGANPVQLDKYWQAFTTMESHVNEESVKLVASLPEGESKRLVSSFAQAHSQMGGAYRKGLEVFKTSNFDPRVGDAAVQGMDREPTKLLEAASLRIREDSAVVAIQAAKGAQLATRVSLVLMFIMAGIGLLIGVTISRQVIGHLGGEPQTAVNLTRRVASGDLSEPVALNAGDSTSLMAQLDTMQVSLAQVVTNVRRSAVTLGYASSEISAGNTDLSNRTETQADALEKSASSMAVLAVAVQINADNAHQANQLASEASQVAVRGGQAVAEVVNTMQGINTASRQISEIIGVIDGIAFQTNILALNAAVEAARAGDQGRGFAVVASEVRSLAGRSAEAAKQIKTLIDTSVARVAQGTAQVDQAGKTMHEVVDAIHRVTDMANQIASECQEQATTVGQIGQIITHMSHTTQQNAALVEEMASAASSLKGQAQELVQTVAVFKLDADGVHSYQNGTTTYNNSQQRALVSLSHEERSVGTEDINLDTAIEAHANWRTKLRSAASKNEQVDANTIGRDDCCELGRWLHGSGSAKFGGKPSFVALIDGHRMFHSEAGKVAHVINQGNGVQAAKMLDSGTPFARTSGEVGRLIVQLKKEINGNQKPAPRQSEQKMLTPAGSASGNRDWETF